MKHARITGILALVALAGCIGDGADSEGAEPGTPSNPVTNWAANIVYAGDDPAETGNIAAHDHSDRAAHRNFSTPNFIEVGWNPLVTDFHGTSSGGYYCGEVSDDAKIAVVNSFSSNVALVVMDVSDPTDPQFLGELVMPNTQIYDSAVTADGNFAILATSPLAPIVHEAKITPQQGMFFRNACGQTFAGPEDELPFVSGTLLVDIRDPTNPSVEDFVPGPAIGPHSVSSTNVGGTDYVASSITNLVYQASYFQFFTVEDVAGQGKLVPYSSYTANYLVTDAPTASDPVGALDLLNGHVDATIYEHPMSGQLLAGLANWDGGLITIDISLPVPVLLSTWGDLSTEAGALSGVIHTAYPVPELVDDKFLFITGQEVGSSIGDNQTGRPSGQIVILDMTNPASPTPVARWTHPTWIQWSGGLHMSTHYVAWDNQTLYAANYHAGIWAIDARPEVWPELPSLGAYLPTNEPPGGSASDNAYAPSVLDVLPLGNNTILGYDSTSGAYVLQFDRSVAVEPAAPWTADAWIS
jgi:hypothetical protein